MRFLSVALYVLFYSITFSFSIEKVLGNKEYQENVIFNYDNSTSLNDALIIYGQMEFDSLLDEMPKVKIMLEDVVSNLSYSEILDSNGDFSFQLPSNDSERKLILNVYANNCLLIIKQLKLKENIVKLNLNDSVNLRINNYFGFECYTTINPIIYSNNCVTFDSSAIIELKKLIFILKQNPDLKIDIASHTDCIGSSKFNLELSKRRSGAVKNYLISNGIEEIRLNVFYFGEAKPVSGRNCQNNAICDENDLWVDRRTEFRINITNKIPESKKTNSF